MRYLVLSDIHSNLPALEAVLAEVDLVHIDEVLCLGDLVGYGPNPNECIARLRELPLRCVAGNHDWAAIGKMDTAEFNSAAREACRWTAKELTAENRAYLQSLPETLTQDNYTLVHGSLRAPIWEYVTHPLVAQRSFELLNTQLCFHGHTHVPVIFREEGPHPQAYILPPGQILTLDTNRYMINTGSVGQPRDGDPRASCLLFDSREATLEYRRVDYPVEETQKSMKEKGLPESLITRLS
ncbi:MAG: metallophosphoesterase family protein, partial [Anaerolineae bacterium]